MQSTSLSYETDHSVEWDDDVASNGQQIRILEMCRT